MNTHFTSVVPTLHTAPAHSLSGAAPETAPAYSLPGASEASLGNPACLPDAAAAPPRLVPWPELDQLGLVPADRQWRRDGIGGSDANILLSGDGDRIRALWQQKRGEAVEADLTDILPVMLGCWTEPFNRMWFEKTSGSRVADIHSRLTCSSHPWRRCTLDGYIEERKAIWEAKHTSAFAKPKEVLDRYMPQLQHNMAVAGVELAILSVIFGNHKHEIFEIASDWFYQIELLQAEEDFWECVQTGREPVAAPAPPPPKPVGVREICLQGNNLWASSAADWLETRDAAKRHSTATSQIKQLVEPDVARAFGHGIEARRSKAGAITIRELSQ